MPWKTLELDPETATAKDVKRAYARRLKTCRPDQDPEGFRKLHEAYTSALRQLEWRNDLPPEAPPEGTGIQAPATAEPERADIPPGSPPSHAPAAASAGEQAIESAADELEQAIKAGATTGIPALVRKLETALYDNPGDSVHWSRLVARLIEIHADHQDLRLKPEAMLFELEHDSCAATMAVVARLEKQGLQASVASLSRFMLEHQNRIKTPAGGYAMSRLAMAAAVWTPDLVSRLSDFAYSHLRSGERDYMMNRIDHHIAAGNLLREVPAEWKNFWLIRLFRQGEDYDWRCQEARSAIAVLNSRPARLWSCYAVLKKLLPEGEAKRLPLPGAPAPNTETRSPAGTPDSSRPQRWSKLPRRDFGSEPMPEVRPSPRSVPPRPSPNSDFEWESPGLQNTSRRQPTRLPGRPNIRIPILFGVFMISAIVRILGSLTGCSGSGSSSPARSQTAPIPSAHGTLSSLGPEESRPTLPPISPGERLLVK